MIQIQSHVHSSSPPSLKLAAEALQKVLQDRALGFHQLPERPEVWQSSKNLAEKLRVDFKTMVVLGIGGSALGGRVIQEVFARQADRQVIFCDSIDPLALDALLDSLQPQLKEVVWVLVSKSGNTIETLTQADYVHQYYSTQQLNWLDQCVVVTEAKSSPLADFADRYQRPRLEIPLDVGGRFSVLTPVGLLPAAFMGLNVERFREGAEQALKAKELIAELVVQSEASFAREEWITVFWCYSQALKELGLWIQQLWAESLAKAVDRQGKKAPRVSSPLPCVGPTDQHSILQQIMEGAPDKLVIFLRHEGSEESGRILPTSLFAGNEMMLKKPLGALLKAEAQATQKGLAQKQISTLTVQIPKMTEKELGFLFMYFELVVATLGERLNINAFNQPGVELGKVIAKNILMGKE